MSNHAIFESAVRRLIRNLFRDVTSADGISPERLESAQGRLGVMIASVLRQYYLLCGRFPKINDANNHVLAPEYMYLEHGRLIFCLENQKAYHWGIPVAYLSDEDPPVQGSSTGKDRWVPMCDHLSTYLLTHLCWQTVNIVENSAEAVIDDAIVGELSKRMWQVLARADDPYDNPISFSEPGLVVCVFRKEMNKTYAAAVSEEKLEQFGEDYGIDLSAL